MTRTRKSLAATAIALAALGGAAAPALADHHAPSPPNSVPALDRHAPIAPLDHHIPLAPQGDQARLAPLDHHIP
ncbi:hypothetical protein ACH4YO_10295 [Streptomyces noursei]|uniref:hypothetical protein n=1 Tax=Streptomyces noursei TaxID=1971 RepID=UPI00167191C6|nr:hypothetical protein [Streptomyces noursei]MCZ1016433.1 hypothetical protein [Streptomyces noursei]GGW99683.1 hypothetical protein GCM10010341_21680 [Streptomyces noursei]